MKKIPYGTLGVELQEKGHQGCANNRTSLGTQWIECVHSLCEYVAYVNTINGGSSQHACWALLSQHVGLGVMEIAKWGKNHQSPRVPEPAGILASLASKRDPSFHFF